MAESGVEKGLEDRLDSLEGKLDRIEKMLRDVGQAVPREIDSLDYLHSVAHPSKRVPPAGGWAATYETISFVVQRILTSSRPPRIVEIGGGISSVWFAYALRQRGSGKLYSIEHDRNFMAKTNQLIEDHGLEMWVELVHAPLVSRNAPDLGQPWYEVASLGATMSSIDVLFVDGPPGATTHMARYPAFSIFAPFLNDGSMVLLDDVDRHDEGRIVKRWKQEWNDHGKLTVSERLGRSTVFEFKKHAQ